MVGLSFGKGLKQVWRIIRRYSVPCILSLAYYASSSTMSISDQKVSEVIQTVLTVLHESHGGSLELVFSPLMGEGDLVICHPKLEEKKEREFNPFVLLAPRAEG